MSSSVEIHEFSTGITPEKLPDGGWVSRGFTGNYMNSTLVEIPRVIYRSIANKDFAVSEGAASDVPTVIGRDIESWSVIALITKGRDEKGRAASFYRYFLTQSDEGLSRLLAFIEERQKQGQSFTFDPFDFVEVNRPHTVSQQVFNTHPDHRGTTDPCQEIPCVLDRRQSCDPVFVNQLATSCSQSSGQPAAWAFNVEALEKPRRFQVIYPASDAAYQRIRQSILAIPKAVSSSSVDEQAIKTALKSLINSSQTKPEHLRILLATIDFVASASSNIVSKEFWNSLFNSQGAENAIRQKIYSSPMTRLLTLRAIVLPKTLFNFLEWISQIPDTTQRQEQENVSLNLQNQVVQLFESSTSLQELALIGSDFLLSSSFTGNAHLEEIAWLINSSDGFWQKSLKKQAEETKHFASQFNYQRGMRVSAHYAAQLNITDTWKKIVSGFRILTPPKITNDPKYINIGNFFLYLREPVLAACCYQSGRGLVPPQIYDEASKYPEFNNGRPYGLQFPLSREKTLFEKFSSFLLAPTSIAVIIVLSVATLAYIFGPSAIDSLRNILSPAEEEVSAEEENSPEGEISESTIYQGAQAEAEPLEEDELIPETALPEEDYLDVATTDFGSIAVPAIQILVNEIISMHSSQEALPDTGEGDIHSLDSTGEEEAIKELATILLGREVTPQELEGLEYSSILQTSQSPSIQPIVVERWIAMFSSYQSRQGLTADGYLENEGDTFQRLKQDLIMSIQNSSIPPIPSEKDTELTPETNANVVEPDSTPVSPQGDSPIRN
ncbi:hypothetical protein [Sphaerothrix gracilis]|uniref:hypothetical protein n=1 Tax=Sphaerothrix gracilis TaxID=3151835 RepID=UPI0031FDBE65